jgi:capsule polysaccharide modification protein KpsS
MGPFFWRLRGDLVHAGARVSKINFCAGDALFYPCHAGAFRGALSQWPAFLADAVETKGVDTLVLFGDCRPYHADARQVAARMGCDLLVFEEGYLRPDYITIERGGVNNHSSMPRDPSAFGPVNSSDGTPRSLPVGATYWRAAFCAVLYGLANYFGAWLYPEYKHHRPLNPLSETLYWCRGLIRKYWYAFLEAPLLARFRGELNGRYFLMPLQVHNDAQLAIHSGFGGVEEIIEQVAHSFAATAPADCALVIKHHPMDRPYRDYGRFLARVARRHGLAGRLYYVHDLHLPTLLQHARGTVVVNSTAGLSSLFHGIPVKTLADPVYNLKGLTFQGSLDEFWREQGTIDRPLYERFRDWLLRHNQANGSFYRRIRGGEGRCGVVWPSAFSAAGRARSGGRSLRPVLEPLSFHTSGSGRAA